MVNSYDEMMGDPMDPGDMASHNVPQATQHYAGDILPLHPPGVFSRNTDSGDTINAVAAKLGVKPPSNVIRFPKK